MKSRKVQGRRPKKSLAVLLVDDSQPVRQALHRLFAGLPQFKVVGEASDGCQALEAITKLRPDVVILDIQMPNLNGVEVLQSLQQELAPPKIIVFSQHDEAAYRSRCLELGAYAYFDKVAEFDKLQHTLKHIQAV